MSQAIAAGLLLSGLFWGGIQAPDVLDLTQSWATAVESSDSDTAHPGRGSASGPGDHTVFERLGLQLKLESLDAPSYLDGDRFEFRTTLRNSSAQAILLPWERDRHRVVTGPDAPMLEALMMVDVESSHGRLTIPIATLYGSSLSPTNTKLLRPGATAEIIASGNWNFMGYSSDDLRLKGVSQRVRVLAAIRFVKPLNGHWYASAESENRIPVVIERRSLGKH
jgi:hypothetical protein